MLPSHPSDFPRLSEEEQRSFFRRSLDLALGAEQRASARNHDIAVAGTIIRLVFAGEALEKLLLPALAHLIVDEASVPDVTFHVWDSESTGVVNIPPPVERHCFSERGDIWGLHSPVVRSAFHWSDFSLNLLDLETRHGVYWIRSTQDLPYWSIASPLRTLFHWWLETRGAQLLHAAAVGVNGRGVLITGRGGVGKSNTALACLAAGFQYVGDDYIAVTGGPSPKAYSLYRTAKLNAADRELFAQFSPQFLRPGDEVDGKAVIMLDNVAKSLDLVAVLTPMLGNDTQTSLAPVSQTLLAGAATYTTMAQLPHAGQQTVDFIEHLIQSLPGRSLVLGTDRRSIPPVIADLIAHPPEPGTLDPDAQALPLVSVIIPVFNGAHFLADAVASVMAQDYAKVEIIVVDDGSKDAIQAAVDALPVQVRFLRQENRGAGAARNHGIQAASGDLFAFLDVDDLMPLHALQTHVSWMTQHPETDASIGRGQVIEKAADGTLQFLGSPAEAYIYYIGSALYRRRAFDRNGLFDSLLRFAEDTDWFVRAEANALRIDRMDVITLHIRRHDANMTRNKTATELLPLRVVRNALQRKRTP